MSTTWNNSKDTAPPKDRPFLAKEGDYYWVSRWYSEENKHPVNYTTGYRSVICDCCDTFYHDEGKYWKEIEND